MRSLARSSAFLALLVSSQVSAQIGNPGGADPGTRQNAAGIPAPNQTNVQDKLFAQQLAIGGMAEVALAKLADRKTQSRAIKDFARLMIEDHGKANATLENL